jgi:hypothetical protein
MPMPMNSFSVAGFLTSTLTRLSFASETIWMPLTDSLSDPRFSISTSTSGRSHGRT